MTWAQLENLIAHPVNNVGTYSITVGADYGGTDVTSSSVNLAVTDTPPTATLTNSGPVNEGSAATVTLNNISDVSDVSTPTTFTYLYDFGNTGTYTAAPTVINGNTATATVPATFLMTPGSHVVNAEIEDQNGGTTFLSTTIQVNYVPPTLTLSGKPDPVAEGTPNPEFALTVSAQDPGNEPIQSWVVNWGDGTPTQTFAGPTPANGTQVTFNHAFANYGPVTITVTAIDANGQVTSTLNETITPIAPQI